MSFMVGLAEGEPSSKNDSTITIYNFSPKRFIHYNILFFHQKDSNVTIHFSIKLVCLFVENELLIAAAENRGQKSYRCVKQICFILYVP
jgi:hypothetical protein